MVKITGSVAIEEKGFYCFDVLRWTLTFHGLTGEYKEFMCNTYLVWVCKERGLMMPSGVTSSR
jgi:hypothetical protein